MAPSLIRATTEQAPLLRELFCEVINSMEFYNHMFRNYELGLYTEQRFSETISEDADAIWLAYLDDIPVGLSVVQPDCDLWWFSWIGVTRAGRGHRLGYLLTANILECARLRGIQKISCATRSENSRSISILRELGFEKVCDLDNHWFGQDYLLWQIKPLIQC